MKQQTNTLNQKASSDKSLLMNTTLIDDLISENTSALSPATLEKNNTASLELRAEKELDFNNFTKVIAIDIWGQPATLMLSQWPIPHAIAKYLPESELISIPKELALITISTAYDSLLTELSNILSTEIIIRQYTPYDKSLFESNKSLYHENSIPFSIELEGGLAIEACLLVDKTTIKHFSPFINDIANSSNISFHNVVAPLYLEYGNSLFTHAEIISIEVGDIVLMDNTIDPNRNQLHLRFSSNKTFLSEKQENRTSYNILEELQSEKPTSSDQQEESLLLTFDLDKTVVSLGQMEQIGIGYTLSIDSDFGNLITVRINNQAIGKGNLVDVNNKVGIRITHLNQQKIGLL